MLALGALIAYQAIGAEWGLFAAVVLLPDAALIAYLEGPRAGAWAYNLSHALLLPGLLALAGWWGGQPIGWQLALIWLVHIGVDRALGFGLKYPRGFRDTHLGRMGTGRPSDHATMRHAPHPADR